MAKHITFEQAKWLKEKGMYLDGYLQDVWLGNKYEKKRGKIIEVPVFGLGSSSKLPEPHQVVDWLFDKHGIWICVSLDLSNTQLFDFEIQKKQWLSISEKRYNTSQEAYSAAFDYIKDKGMI